MTKQEEEAIRLEFEAWKFRRAEDQRKRGNYWISQEGRDAIRDTWSDPEDGNCVLPLLNALEAAEARIEAAYRDGYARGYQVAAMNPGRDMPSGWPDASWSAWKDANQT